MAENELPKLGITMLATCHTLPPDRLAKEVEDRGFESLWLPEHSHIPSSRLTPFPGAAPGREELPDVYWHLNDQLVSLSMAAAATDRLVLGTSVTLVAQHDPIWLAKQLATLDFHSAGRLEVGVGFGWNREEYEAHGHNFSDRYARTKDNVGIMRALWTQDEASFSGEIGSLESSWSLPKPQGDITLILGGGSGPRLLSHLFDWGDGWMPIRSPKSSFTDEVVKVRRLAEEAGRDPESFSITVMNAPQSLEELAELGELGIGRVVFTIWPQEPDAVLTELDRFMEIADSYLAGG
ncbi:MAG: TIGR03619 family F420-dependent LLM class oxidoreductase [Actinomycetota bacterium]|nr:TIGR03619 family F420-dependent LLM class oxidoreductase [Actinomycetota bacterium]